MRRTTRCFAGTAGVFLLLTLLAVPALAERDPRAHKIHDMDRPHPPVVEAQPVTTSPPSDAIVLFGGQDLSAWQKKDGSEPGWKVKNGNMVIQPKTGDIRTKKKFGDCQLHVEWCVPEKVGGSGQHTGNSGVFFGTRGSGRYEVQVLSTPEEEPDTYADGIAGAIYGQYPPLVNACRPKGTWQSYDIIFRRPRFDDEGNLQKPATMTVLHNGVLVQHAEELTGPTSHKKRPGYTPHGKVPIMLQDHKNVVRYRNIWVRPLDESKR